MNNIVKLCALVYSLGVSAQAEGVWPPEPLVRDREPHVLKIDANTVLCEVQWDGHRENGEILDISAEADLYIESVLISMSGEYVFISSDPVQVFGPTQHFQYIDDGVEVELTLFGHASDSGDKLLELSEV
ncbi:hypothetical protein [Ruegeria sp. SCP11]|uniref:hypothetical protein n=1 Tax=Ruegeria sp. SCP11 TaxID=3141378 RepID=UPI003337C45A